MAADCQAWFEERIFEALGGGKEIRPKIEFEGDFCLSSVAHVSGLAHAAMSAAAQQLALLVGAEQVSVNRRRAELWCGMTLKAEGWTLPDSWDPVAGNYRARDGWIRLHTNVPEHLDSTLRVLKTVADREAVAQAVAHWDRFELEKAVVDAGGVAAAMIGIEDWAAHPQGRAVASEPLIHWQVHPGRAPRLPNFDKTLEGLRVLDLTRVLAGPVATRFLAGFGASVLRIDPPHWQEDGLEPEVTLGKACAGLDLRRDGDRKQFETLLSEAHVLVHGYRPGALERLGYGNDRRREINPDIIDVSLSAYGWTGPWRGRRGFDSVVQVNTGLAQEGMERTGADTPVQLPIQVLDHGTGYLMAAAVLYALRMQKLDGCARSARLSLARTAHLLVSAGLQDPPAPPLDEGDVEEQEEMTHWGPARRIAFPVSLEGNGPVWRRQAAPFRSSPAEWP
ncbi:CoA transferase [Thalassovita mangrovi]|uniref:Acyl-CoA transferase n=1 Tax=Thalassovita mangrovi TaxID=2692236 RepID=A0A6L8LTY4_9RHOB|nr:CoA transferase [Thalassovita mangrovi]MYM56609.1 acyl-CoA transferase [Thalassovita mangrovi]